MDLFLDTVQHLKNNIDKIRLTFTNEYYNGCIPLRPLPNISLASDHQNIKFEISRKRNASKLFA